jgi:hypothetical protein
MSTLGKLKLLSKKAVDAARKYDDYRLELSYKEAEVYFDTIIKFKTQKVTEKFLSSKMDMDKELMKDRKELNLFKANKDSAVNIYNNYKLFLAAKGGDK